MTLTLVDLDQTTRDEMVREVDDDAASGRLYLSDRLSRVGRSAYPALLRDAVAHHDEGWLTVQLSQSGVMNTHELVVRRGRMVSARIPHDATTTLAEGEFNRFYLRGLCRRALAEGGRMIEVYRAKPVREPRPQSVALIPFLPRSCETPVHLD